MKTLIKKIIHKGWPVVFLLAILTLSKTVPLRM